MDLKRWSSINVPLMFTPISEDTYPGSLAKISLIFPWIISREKNLSIKWNINIMWFLAKNIQYFVQYCKLSVPTSRLMFLTRPMSNQNPKFHSYLLSVTIKLFAVTSLAWRHLSPKIRTVNTTLRRKTKKSFRKRKIFQNVVSLKLLNKSINYIYRCLIYFFYFCSAFVSRGCTEGNQKRKY